MRSCILLYSPISRLRSRDTIGNLGDADGHHLDIITGARRHGRLSIVESTHILGKCIYNGTLARWNKGWGYRTARESKKGETVRWGEVESIIFLSFGSSQHNPIVAPFSYHKHWSRQPDRKGVQSLISTWLQQVIRQRIERRFLYLVVMANNDEHHGREEVRWIERHTRGTIGQELELRLHSYCALECT